MTRMMGGLTSLSISAVSPCFEVAERESEIVQVVWLFEGMGKLCLRGSAFVTDRRGMDRGLGRRDRR